MSALKSILPRLPEIKALADKATPGPWEQSIETVERGQAKGKHVLTGIYHRKPGQRVGADGVLYPNYCTAEGDVWQQWVSCSEPNRDFITSARTDVPALVEALEEAKALLERVNRISIIRADNLPSALGDSPTLLADIREALGQ